MVVDDWVKLAALVGVPISLTGLIIQYLSLWRQSRKINNIEIQQAHLIQNQFQNHGVTYNAKSINIRNVTLGDNEIKQEFNELFNKGENK